MNGIELFRARILKHTYLKTSDRIVVTDICAQLALRDEPGTINQQFVQQVELEAAASYLVSKYVSIYSRLESEVADYRIGKFFTLGARNDEGLKWTKATKEEWLRASDSMYVVKLQILADFTDLLAMLKDLHFIIFNRDRKLGELSVNYRREMQADRK